MHRYHITCGVLKKPLTIEENSSLDTLRKEISRLFDVDGNSIKTIQVYNGEWDDWLDIDDDSLPPTMSKLRVVVEAEKPPDSAKIQVQSNLMESQSSSEDGVDSIESGEPIVKPKWPSTFRVPAFPHDVQAFLKEDDKAVFSRRYSKKIIHALFEEMIKYTLYPSSAQYNDVAMALVVKYPMLKDKAGNSTGYDTWKESLKNKFKHERAPLTNNEDVLKRKRKHGHPKEAASANNAEQSSVKHVKRDAIKDTSTGEDANSIKRHVEELKELAKKRNPDQDIIADKLGRTRAYRLTFIADNPVKDVLVQFPVLRQENQILKEVEMSFGAQSIYLRLRSTMHTFHDAILQLSGKMKACHGLLETYRSLIADSTEQKEIKELTITACCFLIPVLMGENPDYMYCTDMDPIASTPCLVMKGGAFKTTDMQVLLDGVSICSPSNVPMGLAVMFASYYLYGVQYPKPVRNTLLYFQQYIAALGREMATPVKVQRFVNQIQA